MSLSASSKDTKPFKYEKGPYRLPYNPAPLEPDDDPEFRPGPVLDSPKKKVTKLRQRSRPTKKQTVQSTATGESKANKSVPRARTPFAEYFRGLDLKLVSASEDERQEEEEEDEEEEADGSEGDDEADKSSPGPSKVVYRKARSYWDNRPPKAKKKPMAPGEDSSTELETDDDLVPPPQPPCAWGRTTNPGLKRKSPQAPLPSPKKTKVQTPPPKAQEDFSVTEPETEVESLTEPESDSVTEPDTDAERPKEEYFPRPEMVRKPDQNVLGPFVLDIGKGVGRRRTIVPASINVHLRDYQREGIQFLYDHWIEGQGGLLGDDMGLVSKTIQVIAFLSAIMAKCGDNRDAERRFRRVSQLQDKEEWKTRRYLPPANATWPTCLIIAPSSVVPNWQREFEKWGYFEVGVYSTGKARADVLRDFKYGRLDVMLTTFELARKDISLLDDLAWSCIIVDEVHRVKNPRSKLTDAFSEFQCNIRFGLTGTAIQNSYTELWNILNWTNPGCVGTNKEWKSYVSDPLMRGQSKSASSKEQGRAYQIARILKTSVFPKCFLRRTKDLIKDQLPEKTDEVVFCPLSRAQINVYKRVLQTDAVQNMIRKDEPCDCGSKKLRKQCCHRFDQGDLFKWISALLKISNHLALVLPAPSDTSDQILRNRELCEQIFPDENPPKFGPAMLKSQFCGKWIVLEALLKEWRKDRSNKVLIFTKSVKLLDMMEFHLNMSGLGHVKLDGSVKQEDRMPLIDKFHEDPDIFVFLISTLAGGTGLNLTGANKVVIFDPNWNPAHDLQAMDRAYRYGQTRNVSVYRLLGAGSIEELIYARQVYKQQQMAVGYNASLQTRYFEGVQGDKTKQGELFGIKNIFKLHEDTLATKQAIERATLSDLDWAFANMKPDVKPEATKWVYEAEVKGKKEHSELNGLGALLFDDVPVNDKAEDVIAKTLKDIGVRYTHRNDELMVENKIQVERLKHLKTEEKKKAERAAREKRNKGKPLLEREKTWPPKRRHHKPPPTPEKKLEIRQKALVELGFIASPDDLPAFAHEFARKSLEEQSDILRQLDRHASTNSNAKTTQTK